MKNKMRTLLVVTAVSVTGVLGIGASANAAMTTPTQVSIKGHNGDYYGYVHSEKSSCESNRKVVVYKLLGNTQTPNMDQKIGSDIAQPNGPDSMWSIGNSGFKHGSFYARVVPTSKCSNALSRVIER